MVHRKEQHVRPDPHARGASRYRRRDYQRRRQISVVHEVVLGEPDTREAEPLPLLDLLQALRVEPRVVPERGLLPEVVPEPEGRGVVVHEGASLFISLLPVSRSAGGEPGYLPWPPARGLPGPAF